MKIKDNYEQKEKILNDNLNIKVLINQRKKL